MPKEAAHLDEEDARRLLELLQNEPAKYRAAISFDLLVSRRLGHAQVSTTANIYAHVIASADEKAAQITEKFADIIVPNQKKKGATA